MNRSFSINGSSSFVNEALKGGCGQFFGFEIGVDHPDGSNSPFSIALNHKVRIEKALLLRERMVAMDELGGLVVFDLDGTLLRGPTVCEVLAARLGRLQAMKAFELLTSQGSPQKTEYNVR